MGMIKSSSNEFPADNKNLSCEKLTGIPLTKPVRSKFGEPLTDWEVQRERQIQRSGIIQAAVQSPALSMYAVNYDEWVELVKKTAEMELEFINRR
jgi:hypothetical protein